MDEKNTFQYLEAISKCYEYDSQGRVVVDGEAIQNIIDNIPDKQIHAMINDNMKSIVHMWKEKGILIKGSIYNNI